MQINEITLKPNMVIEGDPLRFRIGTPVVEGGYTVEKILYNPTTRLFNKGLEVGGGCYAVYFDDIPERRLIMEDTVSSIEVVKDPKPSANSEASVAIPS